MYIIDLKSSIDVLMFGRVRQTNGWEHNGMQNARNLLVFVINGTARFCYDGLILDMEKNDAIIIPKNTHYTAHTDSFCEYYFFHFDGEISKGEPAQENIGGALYSFNLPDADFSVAMQPETRIDENVMSKIVKCQELAVNITNKKKLLLNLAFTDILIHMGEYKNSNSENLPLLLSKITAYIQTNYTSSLSLAELSENFGVSKSYIARLFRKFLGTTAVSYINNLKLEHAAELLRNSNMNVSETAEYLGFSDCFYFSRLFKKRFSVSPMKFRP